MSRIKNKIISERIHSHPCDECHFQEEIEIGGEEIVTAFGGITGYLTMPACGIAADINDKKNEQPVYFVVSRCEFFTDIQICDCQKDEDSPSIMNWDVTTETFICCECGKKRAFSEAYKEVD